MSKQVPWNRGLKLSEIPKYKNMGFQKGNKLGDNPKSIATRIKSGQHLSPDTELKPGWNPSPEWIAKQKARTGDKNPSWKGGLENRKPSDKKHMCSKYMGWMFSVKMRDNWSCRIANKDCKGRLEAHHILNWVDYPELRYEINNGITLCHAHHPRKWCEEKRLISEFQRLVSESNDKF